MSLRKKTLPALELTTESSRERLQDLYDTMNDVGVPCMTTEELEEWTYLMALSLEGKGNQVI